MANSTSVVAVQVGDRHRHDLVHGDAGCVERFLERFALGPGEGIAHDGECPQPPLHLLGRIAVTVPDAGLELVQALEFPFGQPRTLVLRPACEGTEERCASVGGALEAKAARYGRESATRVTKRQRLLVRVRLPAPGGTFLTAGLAVKRLLSVPRPAATHCDPPLMAALKPESASSVHEPEQGGYHAGLRLRIAGRVREPPAGLITSAHLVRWDPAGTPRGPAVEVRVVRVDPGDVRFPLLSSVWPPHQRPPFQRTGATFCQPTQARRCAPQPLPILVYRLSL